MRTMSKLVLAAALAAGLGSIAPAQAYDDPRDLLKDEVTIRYNPFIVCVTEPCNQPQPVEVCIHRLENCPPQ